MYPQTRILLVEKEPLVHMGVRLILKSVTDLTLVGQIDRICTAHIACQEHHPDIILLGRDGNIPLRESIITLRRHSPDTKLIVLVDSHADCSSDGLLNSGVAGGLWKGEMNTVLIHVIRAVAEGGTWFSRPVVEHLLAPDSMPEIEDTNDGLSPREWQVLALMARGKRNTQIANELQLAEQTVRNYISRIYAKLEIGSRAEAMTWFQQREKTI